MPLIANIACNFLSYFIHVPKTRSSKYSEECATLCRLARTNEFESCENSVDCKVVDENKNGIREFVDATRLFTCPFYYSRRVYTLQLLFDLLKFVFVVCSQRERGPPESSLVGVFVFPVL